MVQIDVVHVTKRIRKNTVLKDVTAMMHGGRIYGFGKDHADAYNHRADPSFGRQGVNQRPDIG